MRRPTGRRTIECHQRGQRAQTAFNYCERPLNWKARPGFNISKFHRKITRTYGEKLGDSNDKSRSLGGQNLNT